MEELGGNKIIRGEGLNPYGKTLVRLALRAQVLERALAKIQWNGPEKRSGPCPACGRYSTQGHDDQCFIARALQVHDPVERMHETVRFLLDLVRCSANTVEIQTSVILGTLADLQATLDEAAQRLEDM
jgi:hypothetical protein